MKVQCLIFSKYCDHLSSLRPYPEKPLSDLILQQDYAEVRDLTNKLLKDWENLSVDEIAQLLIQNHFTLPQFSFPYDKKKYREINYVDIVSAIKSAQLTQNLPRYYFDLQTLSKLLIKSKSQKEYQPIHWKNKGVCDIQFSEIDEKSMKMKLIVKTKQKDNKEKTIEKQITLYNADFKHPKTKSAAILMRDWSQDDVFIAYLPTVDPASVQKYEKPILGDKDYSVEFSFQNHSNLNLSAISLSEYVCSRSKEVCADYQCSHSQELCTVYSKINGSEVNCSIQSDIFYGHDSDEDLSLRR